LQNAREENVSEQHEAFAAQALANGREPEEITQPVRDPTIDP